MTATADGKPVQGFDPTKTGTWTIPAGTQVNIVDMPDDWKLDGKAEQPAGTVVFTASKYGTPVVTWTFKNDSATDPDKPADPGTDALKNVAATADGKPIAGFDPTRDGAYKVAVIGAVAVLGCFLTGAVLAALGGSSQISTGEDDDPSEE